MFPGIQDQGSWGLLERYVRYWLDLVHGDQGADPKEHPINHDLPKRKKINKKKRKADGQGKIK